MTTLQTVHVQEIEHWAKLLREWIPKDATIVVAIDNIYIYCQASVHHIHLTIGENVHPQSVAAHVLRTRKKTDALMDESIFGTPYYCLGYPITLQNQPAALMVVLAATFVPTKPKPLSFITGKLKDDWIPIPIEHITYIESLQKHTWFYVGQDAYKTTITLKELQLRLPEQFMRIHRSYIINIASIARIKRDFTSNLIMVLKSGIELPVSQSYVAQVRKILEF